MPKIITWIKLEDNFINQENIRSVSRHGDGTKVSLILGDDVYVSISFDKIKELIPSDNDSN